MQQQQQQPSAVPPFDFEATFSDWPLSKGIAIINNAGLIDIRRLQVNAQVSVCFNPQRMLKLTTAEFIPATVVSVKPYSNHTVVSLTANQKQYELYVTGPGTSAPYIVRMA